jgi:hypothetical protein
LGSRKDANIYLVALGIVANNDATLKSINLETALVEKSMALPFAVNVGYYAYIKKTLLLISI